MSHPVHLYLAADRLQGREPTAPSGQRVLFDQKGDGRNTSQGRTLGLSWVQTSVPGIKLAWLPTAGQSSRTSPIADVAPRIPKKSRKHSTRLRLRRTTTGGSPIQHSCNRSSPS